MPPDGFPPEVGQAINGYTNIRYYVAFTQPKNPVCNLFPHLVFLPRMEWLDRGKSLASNVSMGIYGAVNLGGVNGSGGLPFSGAANFSISYHDWNMLSGNVGRFQITDPRKLAEGWFLMRQGPVAVVVHWYFFPSQWDPNTCTNPEALQGYERFTNRALSPILIDPQIMPQRFGENTLQCLNKPWAELPIHAQQSIRTELVAWLDGNSIDGLSEAGFMDRLQQAFPEAFITWMQNNLAVLPNLLRFSLFYTFSYFLNGMPKNIQGSFLKRLPNADGDPTIVRELCCIFPKRFVQFLLNHRQDIGFYANPDFQRDVAAFARFLNENGAHLPEIINRNNLQHIFSTNDKIPKNLQQWLSDNIELLEGWHLKPQFTQRSAAQLQRTAVPAQPILNSANFLSLLKQFSDLDIGFIEAMVDPQIAQEVLSSSFHESFIQWILICPQILEGYLLIKEILQNNPGISISDLLSFAEGLRDVYSQACVDWLVQQARSLIK